MNPTWCSDLTIGLWLVQGCGGADEGFEGGLIDFISFVEIDCAPGVAFKAGVEEF